MPDRGTHCAFEIPYAVLYPAKHVLRISQSGKPPNLKLAAFLRSAIDFSPYFFAVAFVTATTSVSENGVAFSRVKPRLRSSCFARLYVAVAELPDFGRWKTTWTMTPVYSGYMLILPLWSAVWITSVEPMLSL